MAAAGLLKRPRSEDNNAPGAIEVIEISDDPYEIPTAKRQKSDTPISSNGLLQTTAKTNPSRPISSCDQSPSAQKVLKKIKKSDDTFFKPTNNGSTFKNIPDWIPGGRKSTVAEKDFRSSSSRSATPSFPPGPVLNGQFRPKPSVRDTSRSRNITPLTQTLPSGRSSHSSRSTSLHSGVDDATEEAVEKFNAFSRCPGSSTAKKETINRNGTSDLELEVRDDTPEHVKPARRHLGTVIPLRPNLSAGSPVRGKQAVLIPKFPHIEVVIPSPARDLLKLFQGDAPTPVGLRAQRATLMNELERSTSLARDSSERVGEAFGQHGFSKAFGNDDGDGRMKRLAPLKLKVVNRDMVTMDWGEPLMTRPANGVELVHPKQQAKEVLTARFQDHYDPPLTFANHLNDSRLNGKFQFVDRYILRNGVRPAAPISNNGCECKGYCNLDTCQCLTKTVNDDLEKRMFVQPVKCYALRPDGIVVLRDDYISNELQAEAKHFEISECNEFCGCGSSCWNRVVGRGRTVPLEIFETAKCGFGVRSSSTLYKGQFIDLYLGEVINEQELERREDAKAENASSYIYSLDWFNGQNCLHVDGENFGTAMRFVNHSCGPNARSFTVQTNKNDKHVYYLAFFAIRDIPAGTEITIDYSPQEEGNVVDITAEEVQDGRALCYCGASNCRRVLWRDAGRKRKRRKTAMRD